MSFGLAGHINLGDDGARPFGDGVFQHDAIRRKVDDGVGRNRIEESLIAVEALDVARRFASFTRRESIAILERQFLAQLV